MDRLVIPHMEVDICIPTFAQQLFHQKLASLRNVSGLTFKTYSDISDIAVADDLSVVDVIMEKEVDVPLPSSSVRYNRPQGRSTVKYHLPQGRYTYVRSSNEAGPDNEVHQLLDIYYTHYPNNYDPDVYHAVSLDITDTPIPLFENAQPMAPHTMALLYLLYINSEGYLKSLIAPDSIERTTVSGTPEWII